MVEKTQVIYVDKEYGHTLVYRDPTEEIKNSEKYKKAQELCKNQRNHDLGTVKK